MLNGEAPPSPSRPINAVLIASGRYHDIDHARLEILKILGSNPCIRTRVFEDYSRIDAITNADFIISYTCDVTPSLPAQEALRRYIAGGGRWYALHGTNAILRFTEDGLVDTPNLAPHFMETLGTIFQGHPPIGPYLVHKTAAGRDHPLTADIEPFETVDELYLSTVLAEIEVLLAAGFAGRVDRFTTSQWEQQDHPVLYLRRIGSGTILYLTLGHCRGHHDMQPLMEFYPRVERGSWDNPVFHTLLRRGIDWAAGVVPEGVSGF